MHYSSPQSSWPKETQGLSLREDHFHSGSLPHAPDLFAGESCGKVSWLERGRDNSLSLGGQLQIPSSTYYVKRPA